MRAGVALVLVLRLKLDAAAADFRLELPAGLQDMKPLGLTARPPVLPK
jgi:hypothetical protein